MVLIAILLIAVVSILIPMVDRMQKQRKEEWHERKRNLMKIGDDYDDDEQRAARSMERTKAEPLSRATDRDTEFDETGNPYQTPKNV